MTVAAIIQARMGSTRLPGKVLADIAGRPMLVHVIERARLAQTIDIVAVATTTGAADDVLASLCRECDVPVFRGSADDVLDRYGAAAAWLGADVVVRVTADCPFIDPVVCDRVVRVFQEGEFDYVSNTLEPTWPDGLDTEVMSRAALDRARSEASLQSEREHVTPWIRKHPELFRLGSVTGAVDWSAHRWTVDEPADLEFARRAQSLLPEGRVDCEALVAALRTHPAVRAINEGIRRDEGYARSVAADRPARRAAST